MAVPLPPDAGLHGRLPASFTAPGSASFSDFLGQVAPDLLPGRRDLPPGVVEAPHGTTIVAVVHTSGVLMAGDRRATMGNVIAQRDIEKVFPADDFSVVGIAGTPAWPSRWCGCSRSSSSTTRRWRGTCCPSTARRTACRP
jgi:hypothetical protein